MNSDLQSILKKFGRRQLAVSLLGLVVLLLFAIVFARVYSSGHATSTAKIAGQIIRVRDYRMMLDVLEQARLEHFRSIRFDSPEDRLDFTLPESAALLPRTSTWDKLSTDRIVIESLAANNSEGRSILTFEFDRFLFLPYAVLIWAFVSTLSFLPVTLMRRKLVAQFERELQVRLDSEMKEKRIELAHLVSHDIRSPLSALNMVLAGTSDFTEEKRDIAKKAVRRINDIANNLLQSEKPKLFKQPVAEKTIERLFLTPVIETIFKEKQVQFADRQLISFRMKLVNEEHLFALAEESQLARILSNVLNNAVEAISDKGEISINADATSDPVVIEIHDTGKGLSREHLQRIGQKGFSFGKADGASGSGLGLYHAVKTLERFGGTFAIDSEVGVGTTVTLTLRKAASRHL